MTPGLRPALDTDADAVSVLVERAYAHYEALIGVRPGPMNANYRQVIREQMVTVAEVDGELAAVLVLAIRDEGFFVENVAVAPSRQGSGVGRALLDHAEDEARWAGFDAILLFTHELMSDNLAMYAHLGYTEYDRRDHGGACLVHLRKAL